MCLFDLNGKVLHRKNRYTKGSGVQFYRFPEDKDRRLKWIAAVARKNWTPTEYSWICSDHFISGAKSSDPLSPDYVPSVFAHIRSPVKRKLGEDLKRYERTVVSKQRRVEHVRKQDAASALLDLFNTGNGTIIIL